MLKIVLASHGKLCLGMLDTLSLFIGDTQQITAIPFFTQEEGFDAEQTLKDYVQAVREEDTVLIFTDILGGSVNQQVTMAVGDRENIYVITGFNLPVILDLMLMNEDEINRSSIRERVIENQQSIISMREVVVEVDEEDE